MASPPKTNGSISSMKKSKPINIILTWRGKRIRQTNPIVIRGKTFSHERNFCFLFAATFEIARDCRRSLLAKFLKRNSDSWSKLLKDCGGVNGGNMKGYKVVVVGGWSLEKWYTIYLGIPWKLSDTWQVWKLSKYLTDIPRDHDINHTAHLCKIYKKATSYYYFLSFYQCSAYSCKMIHYHKM